MTDEEHAYAWCSATQEKAEALATLEWKRGRLEYREVLRWPYILAEHARLCAQREPPRWATHQVVSDFMFRMQAMQAGRLSQ